MTDTSTAHAHFADLRRADAAPAWLAEAAARLWTECVDAPLHLITVSENASFLVRDGGGRPIAVLRVDRPGYAGVAMAESEIAWVRAVGADTDISVPRVLAGRDGASLQHFEGPGGLPLIAVLTVFVSGTILEDLPDSPRSGARIGAVTAALHTHSRAWVPPEGFSRFDWGIPHISGPTNRWGDWHDHDLSAGQLALLERTERTALERVAATPAGVAEQGLIHADLRPANIIADGDDLTVIDFNDCGYGFLLWDFATALSWVEHVDWAPAYARDWISGYEGVCGPLGEQRLELSCDLSMLRRLQLLAWSTTHREDALPPTARGNDLESACDVASRYAASPTWLLGI